MELILSVPSFVGSVVTFGRRKRRWSVREIIVTHVDNDCSKRNNIFCIVIAAPRARFITEDRVRIITFTEDDLSGKIIGENRLLLYLNKRKSVVLETRTPEPILTFTA